MPSSLPTDIYDVVSLCLEEDVGTGDITAELIPEDKILSATIISRESGTFCGRPWAEEVFRASR